MYGYSNAHMTKRRLQLLLFLSQFQAQNSGKSPTFREMRGLMGVSSNETIEEFLRGLEKEKYIKRVLVGKCRQIKVMQKAQSDNMASQQSSTTYDIESSPALATQNFSASFLPSNQQLYFARLDYYGGGGADA